MRIEKKNIDHLLPLKVKVSRNNWIKIQESLFKKECSWTFSGKKIFPRHREYLFVDKNREMGWCDDSNYFIDHAYKLIKEDDLI